MTRIATKIALTFFCAFVALPATGLAQGKCDGSPGAGKAKLTVEASNLRHGRGQLVFAIYPDDRTKFLGKGQKVGRVRETVSTPVTRACFWLAVGAYAAALYHDENADGKLNRTLFAPKEGFGFSNDAPATIGLPSFKAVRFDLPAAGRTMKIRMRYPG